MKRIKQVYFSIVTFMAALYTNAAMAAGGDPFQKATEKTSEISDYLAGGIALAVTTLVIVIAGFGLMFNKLRQETAMRIIGGALVIGGATSIAAFLFA